ncbi:hypothetical protein G5B46_20130 [Caulobacter sp. 602-2]|uniref:Uncharacterized protein n=1 Tax=Caulobacter sp. 602-2 TaxID=2710887 RepID=A0A6G4R1X7_9CAUL|nr:hypothetical protein [Caulobacter sp. 602-2]NGM51926.1 hypothetical protein [Caulobacter sp. 602-2]
MTTTRASEAAPKSGSASVYLWGAGVVVALVAAGVVAGAKHEAGEERKLEEARARLRHFVEQDQLSRQSEAARFTLADYAMVREGYLESDINRILNGPGHLLGSASTAMPDGAPANATVKSWENADGSSIVVTFEGGVVVAKAQHGLR